MELNNFKFNKKFGQNFIFDKNLLTAIVNDAKINNQDEVLEVGAGAGTLTKIIASKAKKVVSYEIDKNLTEILQQNLQDVENSKVVFADALKTDIKEIESHFTQDYCVVANLPYYITTPLIFKFVQETKRVKSLTIMVQKEVAVRMVSKAGDADYGVLTVVLDFYGDVKLLRNVSRNNFMPRPNVDSAIVQIQIKKNKFECNEENFLKTVKASFSMRRKTLYNNLQTLGIEKEKILACIEKMGLNPAVRGEKLTTGEFVTLSKLLFENA